MPYIIPEIRNGLDPQINLLGTFTMMGDLNYAITKLCLNCHPKGYTDYNALIGVLECVKLELYRRAVAPYEDTKKEENGDVYGNDM